MSCPPAASSISTEYQNRANQKPAITRAALEAFERQSGLIGVSQFLIETGRVIVTDKKMDALSAEVVW